MQTSYQNNELGAQEISRKQSEGPIKRNTTQNHTGEPIWRGPLCHHLQLESTPPCVVKTSFHSSLPRAHCHHFSAAVTSRVWDALLTVSHGSCNYWVGTTNWWTLLPRKSRQGNIQHFQFPQDIRHWFVLSQSLSLSQSFSLSLFCFGKKAEEGSQMEVKLYITTNNDQCLLQLQYSKWSITVKVFGLFWLLYKDREYS